MTELTDMMWDGHQTKETNIMLDEKAIRKVNESVYLGNMIT